MDHGSGGWHHPLLTGLSAAEATALTTGGRTIDVVPTAVLFAQGQPADHVYLVMSGSLELLKAPSPPSPDTAQVVDMAQSGRLVGDDALIPSPPPGPPRLYSVTARAATPVTTLAIPAAVIHRAVADFPALGLRLLAMQSQSLRRRVAHIADLKLKTASQRLGSFLLSHLPDPSHPATISFPYDKRQTARILGITPETLSRALAKLSGLGHIQSRPGNRVHLGDPDGLRSFCAQDDDASC